MSSTVWPSRRTRYRREAWLLLAMAALSAAVTLGLSLMPVRTLIPLFLAVVLGGIAAAWLAGDRNLSTTFLVLFIPTLQMSGLSMFKVDPHEVMLIVGALVFSVKLARQTERPVVLPALVFFGMALVILDIPYFVTQSPTSFLRPIATMTRCVFMAFLIVNLVCDQRMIDLVVRVFIAVALMSATIAIIQVIIYNMTGANPTVMMDPEQAFKPTPIGNVLRGSALLSTVQQMTVFIMLATPFLLFRLTEPQPLGRRLGLGLVLIIMMTGMMLSWNYGGIFATVLVLGLFPFFRWPNRAIHFALAAGVLGLLMYYVGVVDWVYDNSFGDQHVGKGVSERKMLLGVAFDELMRNPWLGTGLDTVGGYPGNYRHRTVHNAGMQAWTGLGLVGLLVYLAMLLTLFTQVALLGLTRHARSYHFRALTLGFTGLVLLLFSEPFMGAHQVWFFFALAQASILVHRSDGLR